MGGGGGDGGWNGSTSGRSPLHTSHRGASVQSGTERFMFAHACSQVMHRSPNFHSGSGGGLAQSEPHVQSVPSPQLQSNRLTPALR